MKKEIIIFIFLALTLFVAKAQDDTDPVEVDMKTVNLSPSFFDINIPIIGFEVNRPNSAMFAGIGAKLKTGRIYVETGFNLFYANSMNGTLMGSNDAETETESNSIYKFRSPQQFFFNTGFVLMQKTEETDVVFKLRQHGRTQYYTKIPTKQSNFIMINLGFKTGFNWVYCKGKDLTFDGADVPEGFTPPLPENVKTMMDFTVLRVGASYGKMGFWKAKIKKYGTRTNKKFFRYYADLLILIASNVDPIYAPNNVQTFGNDLVYVKYDLNNTKRSPVGFVVGVSRHNLDKFGANYGAELGYYPGLKGGFLSNVGLTINAAISFGKVFN